MKLRARTLLVWGGLWFAWRIVTTWRVLRTRAEMWEQVRWEAATMHARARATIDARAWPRDSARAARGSHHREPEA